MTAGGWGMRVGVAAALGVDAYVHFALSGALQIAAPGGIGGGTLFRFQAAAAVVAAVYILAAGSRLAFVLAGLVGLSALVPVVLFSLVEVPAIGPIPSMYDPTWYPLKTLSAIAEGVAVVLVLIHLLRRHPTNPPESQRIHPDPNESRRRHDARRCRSECHGKDRAGTDGGSHHHAGRLRVRGGLARLVGAAGARVPRVAA